MNLVGDSIVPYKETQTVSGKGFEEFEPKKAIELIFKGYGLTDVAKTESVNVGVSVDGTNISKRIKTMVGGLKINAHHQAKILSEFQSEGKQIDEFLLGVEKIVNTCMLGTVESPSQWKVPTNMPSAKLDTQIGIICMINGKSVTMVDCLGDLIQYCIPPTEKCNEEAASASRLHR
eukprot:scaffold298795_cov51-Attheya_sp.AAC.2